MIFGISPSEIQNITKIWSSVPWPILNISWKLKSVHNFLNYFVQKTDINGNCHITFSLGGGNLLNKNYGFSDLNVICVLIALDELLHTVIIFKFAFKVLNKWDKIWLKNVHNDSVPAVWNIWLSQGTNMFLNGTESTAVANVLSISTGSAQWREGAVVGRVKLLHIPLQEHFNMVPKSGTKTISFTRRE